MTSSVINLCDSDSSDRNETEHFALNDSSSSASSEDEELWTAGLFFSQSSKPTANSWSIHLKKSSDEQILEYSGEKNICQKSSTSPRTIDYCYDEDEVDKPFQKPKIYRCPKVSIREVHKDDQRTGHCSNSWRKRDLPSPQKSIHPTEPAKKTNHIKVFCIDLDLSNDVGIDLPKDSQVYVEEKNDLNTSSSKGKTQNTIVGLCHSREKTLDKKSIRSEIDSFKSTQNSIYSENIFEERMMKGLINPPNQSITFEKDCSDQDPIKSNNVQPCESDRSHSTETIASHSENRNLLELHQSSLTNSDLNRSLPEKNVLSVYSSEDDSSLDCGSVSNKIKYDDTSPTSITSIPANEASTNSCKEKVFDFDWEINGVRNEVSRRDNFQSKWKVAKSSITLCLYQARNPPVENESNTRDCLDTDSIEISFDDYETALSGPFFTPCRSTKKTSSPLIGSVEVAAIASTSDLNKLLDENGSKLPSSSSSKLLTPCMFSPPLISPLGAFSIKRKVPTPSIPAMSKDLINEIGGRLYPDLRHLFVLALTSHARKLRHNSYERALFDSALRSIVVISLHLHPLRSADAVKRIKGVGANFYNVLKESLSGFKGLASFSPQRTKHSSVAAAALVALLEFEEVSNANDTATTPGVPMEDLIQSINRLLDSRAKTALNQTVEQYMDLNNLDPGWWQVKKLCSAISVAGFIGPFVKQRKNKLICASGIVFELLDSGREIAKKLRDLARKGAEEPGPLRQLPYDSVDEEFGNVTMSMDYREGGGESRSLHKICDYLDIRGIPYVVRELRIADYVFFVGDKLAPILIERKSADDLAGSLHDGRWEKQQRHMRKAQYVLGGGPARKCQISYIIEGDANKRKVHGGNVGRRNWFQSVEDVENAIKSLPQLGFSVMRSRSPLDTIRILAMVVQDVSWKAKNDSIDINFTYQQFMNRVKSLGEEKGDPPTSSEHQNPAPPVVVHSNHVSQPTSTSFGNNESPIGLHHDDVHATTVNCQNDPEELNASQLAELKKLSISELKECCKARGEKVSGKKYELIARLLKPQKPEILIMRARRREYIPKIPSSNSAIMVALLLHHVPGTQGISKERLMVLAEETGISKESMSGDGGFYDGWSGIKQLLEGDPALVRKEKGNRYSLTTQPPELAGVAVAHALHVLAHREKMCNCATSPE